MKVIKRNGQEVDFDKNKIINAITKAFMETENGVDNDLIEDIVDEIEDEIFELEYYPTVETIQDMVEEALMGSDRKDVAKKYILYREERNKLRGKPSGFKLVSDDFVKQYKNKKVPMTDLGSFVYYRTYSRWMDEEKRRENWWETARRAVEFNASLANTPKEEVEKLYDNVFNLKQFLSGRTFWIGNTEVSKKYALSNFNCFSEDTQFMTSKGVKRFSDFQDGDNVEVLNKNGGWAKATVRNFGKDEIVNLTVRKKGTTTTEVIETTKDHIWFKRQCKSKKAYDEKKTIELKKGDILRLKRRYENQTPDLCGVGIMHGIVYGDGTYDKKKNHCRISLIGQKKSLANMFFSGNQCTEGDRDSLLIYGLPKNWKSLPDETHNIEYINGFLYGLILTDGSSSSGGLTLTQANKKELEYIKSLFSLVGVLTSKVKENKRSNSNFGDYENPYRINIYKDTLPKNWTIFNNTGADETLWIVDNITFTKETKDVFCVVEPETNTFTLANGILTHNCAGIVIDNYKMFSELFYLLLVGAGVGIRVLPEDVVKMPKIRTDIKLVNKYYTPIPKKERAEYTSLTFEDDIAEIIVGDSKEGWVQSLEMYFNILTTKKYRKINTLIINYDHIRPLGERLKTFGGTASGHTALEDIFSKIDNIISKHKTQYQLSTIDCLDIANIIGSGVVVGGVRRTAEIGLGSIYDKNFVEAKSNLYTQEDGIWTINKDIAHRQMSNNSIFYTEKPSREQLHWQINQMKISGEPAFINAEAAKKRRSDFQTINPCSEILLESQGCCNLTTVNVLSFVQDGKLNKKELLEAQRLSARAGYRMTFLDLELHEWDLKQKRDRLVGCSLTGWQDMVNATKMTKKEESTLLEELREVAHCAIDEYSNQLGTEKSLLVTTVKPEGTLSQLPTVSSGVHYSHSPYFIRRVRVNSQDPVLKVCEELGYPIFPEVGQDKINPKTKVVEFPVKAPEGRTKYDITAIEQLENYKMFMENYVDHNCSITVHVREHEWDEVEECLWDNWDSVVGVSFLALDDSFYELLPYESITKEEYEKRKSEMKAFVPSLISKYETQMIESDDLVDSECSTSSCPIR